MGWAELSRFDFEPRFKPRATACPAAALHLLLQPPPHFLPRAAGRPSCVRTAAALHAQQAWQREKQWTA